jgi:AsmA protein
MARMTRFALIAVGAVVLLIVLVAVCLPLFLNADSFRTRIESTLTKSLGRKVTIGKLDLSVWSGGLVATNSTVADDPAFSTQPFIQADSVKIGVEILPLIFSKQLHIRGFSLVSPKVQLLRAVNGTWNYSTIGKSAAPSAQDAETKQTFPDLTVGHVTVENGRFTVGTQPAAGAPASAPARVYDQVNLEVKDFGFRNSFPFSVSAHLPADGTVSLSGTAGPINQQDASATPFSGHLEMKHIDPLAAGFVDASAGITGLVESMVLDASWNGQQMHVTKLLVDTPHLTLVRSNAPAPPKPAGANPEGATMLENLYVDNAQVKNGSVTLTTAGQTGSAVYQQLNAQITNLTPKTASPFTVSAQLPGGGTLNANGTAGPFNQQNNAATPVNAQVTLKHVELASSGVLPPDAGIGGTADLQAQIQSNGQTLNATGSTQIAGIKLAKNGQPSSKPVQVQFAVAQNEQAMTGEVQKATFTVGRAVINMNGTYQSSGPTTAINLKVNGDGVPIDELEAFLPAAGVRLPQGSALRGGTLTTALTVSGSTANPVISGPVRLNNTQLAGFDLGSKLQTLSQLTGGKIGSATGSGTNIRSLSMNIREADGAIQTDNIALDVAGVGTATGAGTVSAAGALNYNMILKLTELAGGASGTNAAAASPAGSKAALLGSLAGMIGGGAAGAGGAGALGDIASGILKNGIPVAIGGTTSNPTFAPNLRGVASGVGASAGQQLLKGKTNPKQNGNQNNPLGNALGGLLNHH